MAGLRHKARHKFLPEEVSAMSRPVPLFWREGVCPGTGLKIGNLLADAISRMSLTMPSPDGIAFVISKDERVGTLHYFPCENEVGFTLLNF